MAKRKSYYDIQINGKIRSWGKAYFFGKDNSIPKSVTKDVESKYHKGIGQITTMKIEKWWVDKQYDFIWKPLIVEKEKLLTLAKVKKLFKEFTLKDLDNGNMLYVIDVGEDNAVYVSSALRFLEMEDQINDLKKLKGKGLIDLRVEGDNLYVELTKEFLGNGSTDNN